MDERPLGQDPKEQGEVYIRSWTDCKDSISMVRLRAPLIRRYLARAVGGSSSGALADSKDCLTSSMKLKS